MFATKWKEIANLSPCMPLRSSPQKMLKLVSDMQRNYTLGQNSSLVSSSSELRNQKYGTKYQSKSSPRLLLVCVNSIPNYHFLSQLGLNQSKSHQSTPASYKVLYTIINPVRHKDVAHVCRYAAFISVFYSILKIFGNILSRYKRQWFFFFLG